MAKNFIKFSKYRQKNRQDIGPQKSLLQIILEIMAREISDNLYFTREEK